MFKNYILVAFRNLIKQKLFTAINIFGLVIGLMALILANGLVNYEESYDSFFPNHDRIFIVAGSYDPRFSTTASYGIGIPSPVRPLIEENLPDIQYTARLWMAERVAKVEDKVFYQNIRFADRDFTKIFNFDFIEGNRETALNSPNSLIITELAALKYFGKTPALGKSITIDNRLELIVTGIIKDIPKNSHFRSYIGNPLSFEFITNIENYEKLTNEDLGNSWGGNSSTNLTYALLSEGDSPEQIDPNLLQITENHQPEEYNLYNGYFLIPMTFINLTTWDAVSLPLPQTIRIVGLMVLLVAIINYANLANAQYMGRIREIGLRKSLGSSRKQLFVQFFTESIVISLFALVIALGLIVLALEPISISMDREFNLGGLLTPSGLITLTMVAIGTGFLGGLYPALKISRTPAIACLSDRGIMDGGKGWLRNTVVGMQFGVAILLASSGAIIYAQNLHIENKSLIFDKHNTILIDKVDREEVAKNFKTFKELTLQVPNVLNVTASNTAPFQQFSDNNGFALAQGDKANEVIMHQIFNDHDFFKTYQYPVIAGRDFNENIALDTFMETKEGENIQTTVNVIINEIALQALGWKNYDEALSKSIYFSSPESPPIAHRIVGIVGNVNYKGAPSQTKPMIFKVQPSEFQIAAIHIAKENHAETIQEIENIWQKLNPEFPIVRKYLNDEFMTVFRVLQTLAGILGGFAIIAVFVAFIGLFGMSAFVTQARTKELGIRKVLGATVNRLVRFMVFQISIPVLVAMIPASLLAWASMRYGYLQLFPERIENLIPFIGTSSGMVLILAWIIVAVHAFRVANLNPVTALRYE